MSRPTEYFIKNKNKTDVFEEIYKSTDDPWNQSSLVEKDYSKALILNACKILRNEFGQIKILEIGCGLGYLTKMLNSENFNVTGIDISPTAIEQAIKLHPSIDFKVGSILDFDLIEKINPDVIIMAEITWYILDNLDELLSFLKKNRHSNYLLHSLSIYSSGHQQYGKEFFSTTDEILSYFNLDYIVHSEIWYNQIAGQSFFLAKI